MGLSTGLRIGAAITAVSSLAACTSGLFPPDDPPTPKRAGPAPQWSAQTPAGLNRTVVVGRVAVVLTDEAVMGLDVATGRRLWRSPSGDKHVRRVTDEVIVDWRKDDPDGKGPFTVIDPATGRTLWRGESARSLLVTQDAIFVSACDAAEKCATTRHEPRTGEVRWTVPAESSFPDDRIGVRAPLAAPTGDYVPTSAGLGWRPKDRKSPSLWGVRDTRTGRPAPGRAEELGWHQLVVGRTLISTDHDPPEGDERCTVTVQAVDAESGRRMWTRKVFSHRGSDGECEKFLAPLSAGMEFIGADGRVIASTEDGRPQLFDLRTGRTVWRADRPGMPLDGDGRSVLIRDQGDRGELALLDFATGRTRWTAPDPGLEHSSASWRTMVTRGLVAVTGAEGGSPHVLVYRVADGRLLGRFPGWLHGLGDDWAVVGSTRDAPAGRIVVEFIRF